MWNEQEQTARSKAVASGVVFWKPDDDFKSRMDTFRKDELSNLAEDMRKRGVTNSEKLIKLHLSNIQKWKDIFAKIDRNPARLEEELRREIYTKVLP